MGNPSEAVYRYRVSWFARSHFETLDLRLAGLRSQIGCTLDDAWRCFVPEQIMFAWSVCSYEYWRFPARVS